MKIITGLFLELLISLNCLILIYNTGVVKTASADDVTENNLIELSDSDTNSGICDILNVDSESEQCSFVLNKIDGDSEVKNDLTFSDTEYIDGDRLLSYLKGKSDFVQSFLLKIVTRNWDKLNGTETSLEKLEILADFHKKKEYSEKVEMLSQDVKNGDILKLMFSELENPDEISSQLNRVMLSPSALVNAIRNGTVNVAYSGDPDVDPAFFMKDFVTGMSQKDEQSLNLFTSLVLGLMNETSEHIEKNGLEIAENFTTTVLGIVRPIYGGVEQELRMYITLLGNAAQEVSKGNWTALGDHVKAQFNHITLGQPGNLSQAVGGQGGPQVQAIAVALDIFIGFIDGVMKSAEIVDKINTFIPLSFGEKFEEGIRAFLRYQPSQNIQILTGTKTGNNELAQFAARFLEDNENVQALVLPSVHYSQSNCRKDITVKCILLIFGLFCDKKCDQSFGMHQNSVVMLDNTTDVYLDRARPDSLEKDLTIESTIFCQPGNLEETSMSESSVTGNQFYCNNAFGVRRLDDDLASGRGINIISLGDGVDTATGFKNASNVFLVGAGHKIYTGGNQSDAFVLTGGDFTGDLDGDGNLNTLVIGDQFGEDNGVLVDLTDEKLLIGTSRKRRSRSVTRLRNFHSIVGRTNRPEKIICACSTGFVNGRGGSAGLTGFDKIEIPRAGCPYNLHVVLNNYTVVENEAISGKFIYDIPFNTEHSIQISEESLTSLTADHVISFDYSLANMSFIRFDKGRNELIIGDRGSSKQSGFPIGKIKNTLFYESPKFVTKLKNGTNTVEAEIRVSSEGSSVILHHLVSYAPRKTQKQVGFPGVKNIFMLQSGSWNISGSGSENVFVLENDTFNGFLEGGGSGSHNVLVLGQLTNHKVMHVNMKDGFIISDNITIHGVENVVGREHAEDKIIAACTTQLINGRGGASSLEPDVVVIENQESCEFNLRIIIHEATKVLNSATQGNFYYEVRTQGPLDVEIVYLPETNASHHFMHEFTSQNISNLTFHNSELQIEVKMNASQNSKYNYSHKMKPLTDSKQEFYSQPNIVTADGVELKLASSGEIFGFIKAKLTQEHQKKIQGIQFVRNVFYINSTHEKTPKLEHRAEVVGGEFDDLFVLSGEAESTTQIVIDGGQGQDTVSIDSNFASNSVIELDLREETFKLSSRSIQIRNIEIVHGRGEGKPDEITVGCDTKYISGFETIQIPENNSCNYSLTLEICSTTIMTNNATKGNFNYKFRTLRSFDADSTGSFSANHSYFLNLELIDIQQIMYDKIQNTLKYVVGNKSYEHKLKTLEKNDLFHKLPRIFTSDKSELKVSRWGSIYVSQISGKRLGEILDLYPGIAERLNITISVETEDGAAVLVGSGYSANILQNKRNMQSHLIGRGSENMFRIISAKHDVYIYPPEGITVGENILDFSDVISPIRKERGTMYSPEILQDGEDIIFKFDDFRVILTNGRNWWRNIKVIYDVAVLDLKPEFEFDDSTNVVRRQKRSLNQKQWRVQQAPLILDDNAEIVILTTSDLEPGTEVQVGGHTISSNFEFIKMDNSLLLTNYGNRGSQTGGNLKTLVFTNCFDKSSNFLADNISVNFTQEHLTYKLEVAGKVVSFKTFSQVQSELRVQAFEEVYPEESKQRIPAGVIIVISVAAVIVLSLLLITGLFIWRKRSSGFYVVSWIDGCFRQKPKQYTAKY